MANREILIENKENLLNWLKIIYKNLFKEIFYDNEEFVWITKEWDIVHLTSNWILLINFSF
jgi:hypothetical protein